VLGRARVPTPSAVVIEGAALRDLGAGAAMCDAVDRVGLPCVVKPSRSGSALGVGFVEREAELAAAVMSALSYSDAALIEAKVEGTEVAAAMLGAPFEALPLVEIVPKGGVYDYAARYTSGATEYFTPARFSQEIAERVQDAARRTAEAFHVRDLTRVDAIVDRAGRPWILEINVSPGMTETSLVPMAARAAGMTLRDVCDVVIRSARARG
jgi:D-alanine-D-alanine ligase